MTAEEKVKHVYPKARYKFGAVSIPKPAIFWSLISSNQKNERRAWADAWRRIQKAKESNRES